MPCQSGFRWTSSQAFQLQTLAFFHAGVWRALHAAPRQAIRQLWRLPNYADLDSCVADAIAAALPESAHAAGTAAGQAGLDLGSGGSWLRAPQRATGTGDPPARAPAASVPRTWLLVAPVGHYLSKCVLGLDKRLDIAPPTALEGRLACTLAAVEALWCRALRLPGVPERSLPAGACPYTP